MNLRQIASQPKSHSFLESIFNVAVGLGINVTAQAIIFPWFGIFIPLSSNLQIAMIFTVISIVRSYCLRRGMNWYHTKDL